MELVYLAVPIASLLGAIVAGFFGGRIGRKASHIVTIAGVGTSFLLSLVVLSHIVFGGNTYNGNVYTWAAVEGVSFNVGFLIDNLTAMMMVVVTFVSLMVHVYNISYM